MSSNHDDSLFVRNFSLLLVGLVAIGLTAFVLAKMVNSSVPYIHDNKSPLPSNVAPVGELNTGSVAVAVTGVKTGAESAAVAAAPTAAASSDPGKATYSKVCFACHEQGIAGAPKFGDVGAWESRVAQGRDTLLQHALSGYTGQAGMMPARGGNPALTDAEVGAAVEYMMNAVGSNKAAAAPVAAPAAAATPTADAAAAEGGKGRQVFDSVCFVCHTPGAAGAPKFGDAAAWAPRIEKGIDALYHSSLNGFMGTGMMPPKGGRPDLSDDDVKAAVDYMVSNSK